MNIGYICKKLGIPILALIVSCFAVAAGYRSPLAEAYLIFAAYTVIAGILIHFIGEAMPRSFRTEKGIFSVFGWENEGRIYEKMFHVTAWKDSMTDASKMFRGVKSKNTGRRPDRNALSSMIQEMCVSEACHWILTVLGVSLIWLIRSSWKWLFFTGYTLFNLADIIIQRYNRPRLVKMYVKLAARERQDECSDFKL